MEGASGAFFDYGPPGGRAHMVDSGVRSGVQNARALHAVEKVTLVGAATRYNLRTLA
jgi:hypothetical protein